MRRRSTWSAGGVDDRAQIHTIEGFAAAFIVLVATVFALQAVSITPTSSSTASQAVETQNFVLVDDLLAATAADGSLKEAVLRWDNETREFEDSDGRMYVGSVPPGGFGEAASRVLLERGIAFNADLRCGGRETGQPWINHGSPSKHAVTGSHTLVLDESDRLTTGDESSLRSSSFDRICPNVDEDTDLYNVVEVRIVAWRM